MKDINLSESQQTVLMMRGLIAGLDIDTQKKIMELAQQIREIAKTDEGRFAIGIVGAELAAES